MKLPLFVATLIVLAGCAQPEAAPSPQLDPALGVAPTITAEDPAPAASPSAVPVPSPAASVPSATASTSPAATPTAEPTPTSEASPDVVASPAEPMESEDRQDPPTTSTEPVVLLAVSDTTGDHGARGPAWADLTAVEFVEIGNDLRVTLRFDGELPAAPPEGEVPLVGVNIGNDGYQLFVEGGGQAWAAYLDTPEGFVAYPGTFELAGSAMVLQVPFNAVGSPTRADVTAFVEWSRDSGTLGVLNPTSEDQLDGEPHTFDRSA